jgi:soluble lytic murein transglycosylase-like protein
VLRRPFTVVLFLLTAHLVAAAGEVAVLRNGFTISHNRREQIGEVTRLYMAEGYVDVPTEQIASIEPDEAPQPQSAEDTKKIQPAIQPTQFVTPQTSNDLDELIREASARQQLDPDFVSSVIKAESNFHPRAVSPKGAQGLMQLMPGTATKLGVSDPFDPKANVEAGTAYLNQLLNLYDNDPIKALAAYNAGPQRVQQYHGVPPYRETKLYINRIVRDFNAKKAKQRAASKTAQAGEKKNGGSGAAATALKSKGTAQPKNKTKEEQAGILSSQAPHGTK